MASLIGLCCLTQQPVCPEGQTGSPLAQWESVPDCSGTKNLHTHPWDTEQGWQWGCGWNALLLGHITSRSAWLGGQHSFPTTHCTGHRVDHVCNSSSSQVEKSGVYWVEGVTREWKSQENQPHLAASPKAKVRPHSHESYREVGLTVREKHERGFAD